MWDAGPLSEMERLVGCFIVKHEKILRWNWYWDVLYSLLFFVYTAKGEEVKLKYVKYEYVSGWFKLEKKDYTNKWVGCDAVVKARILEIKENASLESWHTGAVWLTNEKRRVERDSKRVQEAP